MRLSNVIPCTLLAFASNIGSLAWTDDSEEKGNDLDLSGVAWSVSGDRIRIEAASVRNNNASGRSGTLQLRVWAFNTPFTGTSMNGFILGTLQLGQLDAGFSFTNINTLVPFNPPPDGTYWTTMFLEEFDGDNFIFFDWVTFATTATFGEDDSLIGCSAGGGLLNTQDGTVGDIIVVIFSLALVTAHRKRKSPTYGLQA